MISIAVGALLGDAFFHLIPEVYEHDEDGNNLSPNLIATGVISGLFLFFLIEKVLHSFSGHSHN